MLHGDYYDNRVFSAFLKIIQMLKIFLCDMEEVLAILGEIFLLVACEGDSVAKAPPISSTIRCR